MSWSWKIGQVCKVYSADNGGVRDGLAIARNPSAQAYTDTALLSVADDDSYTLDLLTKTDGAGAAVARAKAADRARAAMPVTS